MNDKKPTHQRIHELVERFSHNHALYTQPHSAYNETQLRSDFINQFLQALGWDVYNAKQAPQHLREVVQEDTLEVEEGGELLKRNPDYALRLGAKRKFFVEVKRPSIPILTDKKAAFQLRRYGWNAGLAVSVLTNFDKLVIYDCRLRPQADDEAHVARLEVYDYTDYVSKFDEIYERLGREAFYSGKFDELFGAAKEREGTEPFDRYFLKQIEQWRMLCAQDLIQQNPGISQEEINFLIQQLLNRIIFLRICEDRELEKYKTLQQIHTYAELKELFCNAEQRYDSGLFDFIEDTFSLTVDVSDNILVRIFQELYYPKSPYSFSVVESSVLGEIYELFLAQEIALGKSTVTVREKPEIAASQGVVATPKYIVDEIVTRTLDPLCKGKSPAQLVYLRVADIACGSGSFLLAVCEYLLNHALEWYLRYGAAQHSEKVYQGMQGNWYLTLAEKQRIVSEHIFGVDIDPQAVEVTRFSLLLKVLEGERGETLDAFAKQYKRRALPNLNQNIQCGNSLTDSTYFHYDNDALTSTEQIGELNPLDWDEAFPAVMQVGGFDAIVGNPPYIRIQNMVRYSPKEAAYYQSETSPYTCARSHNFDKYSLFIERALSLLKPTGRLGYIVPHKFFTIQSGRALRQLLASGQHIDEIVHFGVQQVFGAQRTTYTCLLFLNKQTTPVFQVEHVAALQAWRYGTRGLCETYQAGTVSDTPWEFVSPQLKTLFERLRSENPTVLEKVAQIFVGVQTSADNIYILHPTSEQ